MDLVDQQLCLIPLSVHVHTAKSVLLCVDAKMQILTPSVPSCFLTSIETWQNAQEAGMIVIHGHRPGSRSCWLLIFTLDREWSLC